MHGYLLRSRKKWYDRDLIFYLPGTDPGNWKDADENGHIYSKTPPEAIRVDMEDGEYSVEVAMTGGSGRAGISSPTLMTVRDGRAYATLVWSSSYYDYLILENYRYDNLTTDGGNSSFKVPVTAFDVPVPIIADTTAMGDPVEINYTLTFYEETIGSKGDIPQEAAKKVIMIALAIIVVGGILNHFVKRRYYQ